LTRNFSLLSTLPSSASAGTATIKTGSTDNSGDGIQSADWDNNYAFNLVMGGGIIDWSAGRPNDQIDSGEWGATTETGLMFFMDPLVTYGVYASKAGYNSVSTSVTPSLSDYKLYMTSTESMNVSTQFSDIYWNITPTCGGIYNGSTQFIYYIHSSNNSLFNYGLNISLNGTTYVANGTNSAGGFVNITLNLTPYPMYPINITYWFNKTGYPLYTHLQGCYVWNTTFGNTTLWGQMADFKNMVCPVPMAGAIPWCPPLNALALLVMTGIAAVATVRFGINGGGIAATVTMWTFVAVEWFPWQPAVVMTLGMIGVIVLKGGF
jgi:hypothetical protein